MKLTDITFNSTEPERLPHTLVQASLESLEDYLNNTFGDTDYKCVKDGCSLKIYKGGILQTFIGLKRTPMYKFFNPMTDEDFTEKTEDIHDAEVSLVNALRKVLPEFDFPDLEEV